MKAKTMKRKRWMGLLLSVLMITGLAASMTMQVSAASPVDAINDKASSVITDALKPYLDQIDMTKKGSLELTLTKFSDGEVSIYPIMTEDGYLYDTKTGKASDNLASLIVKNPSLATQMAAIIKDSGSNIDSTAFTKIMSILTPVLSKEDIKAKDTQTISNGAVKFSDLGAGLYMVKLTKTPSNGYSFVPFLISLPDSKGNYDIVGEPKSGVQPPTTPDNPNNPSTPTSNKTSYGDKLPQTGQLWWPVPLMALVGLILLTAGVKRRRSSLS